MGGQLAVPVTRSDGKVVWVDPGGSDQKAEEKKGGVTGTRPGGTPSTDTSAFRGEPGTAVSAGGKVVYGGTEGASNVSGTISKEEAQTATERARYQAYVASGKQGYYVPLEGYTVSGQGRSITVQPTPYGYTATTTQTRTNYSAGSAGTALDDYRIPEKQRPIQEEIASQFFTPPVVGAKPGSTLKYTEPRLNPLEYYQRKVQVFSIKPEFFPKKEEQYGIPKSALDEFGRGISFGGAGQGTKTTSRPSEEYLAAVNSPMTLEFTYTHAERVAAGMTTVPAFGALEKIYSYYPDKVKKGITFGIYGTEFGKGLYGGVKTELTTRPIATAGIYGVGYLTGGTFGALSSIGSKTATGVKLIGGGLTAMYAGSTALQIYTAPTSEARGRVVGKSGLEFGAFMFGAARGAKTVINLGLEPQPDYVPRLTFTKNELDIGGGKTKVLSRSFGSVIPATGKSKLFYSYTSDVPVKVQVLRGDKFISVKESELYDLPFRTPSRIVGKVSRGSADISFGLSNTKSGEVTLKSLESPFIQKEFEVASTKGRYMSEKDILTSGDQNIILGGASKDVSQGVFDIQKQIIGTKGVRTAKSYPTVRTLSSDTSSNYLTSAFAEPKTLIGKSKFVGYGSTVSSQYLEPGKMIEFQGKNIDFGSMGDYDLFARTSTSGAEPYINQWAKGLNVRGEKVFVPKDETLQIRPKGKEGKVLEAHATDGAEAESAPERYFGLQLSGRGYNKFAVPKGEKSINQQVMTLGESSARYGASTSGYSVRKGKYVVAPQENRLKDLPRQFMVTEAAIKQSSLSQTRKTSLLNELENIKSQYPRREGIKITAEKTKEIYLSPTPSKSKSFSFSIPTFSKSISTSRSSKSIIGSASVSVSTSKSSSKSLSTSVSTSKSISESISASISKSVSKTPSQSISSLSNSFSFSPSVSPKSSSYSISSSPSPSPKPKSPPPGGFPYGIDLFGGGRSRKGKAKFKKKYVASIEAEIFNIKAPKGKIISGEFTGLGIRPLK
jgi:hypothetical protein